MVFHADIVPSSIPVTSKPMLRTDSFAIDPKSIDLANYTTMRFSPGSYVIIFSYVIFVVLISLFIFYALKENFSQLFSFSQVLSVIICAISFIIIFLSISALYIMFSIGPLILLSNNLWYGWVLYFFSFIFSILTCVGISLFIFKNNDGEKQKHLFFTGIMMLLCSGFLGLLLIIISVICSVVYAISLGLTAVQQKIGNERIKDWVGVINIVVTFLQDDFPFLISAIREGNVEEAYYILNKYLQWT